MPLSLSTIKRLALSLIVATPVALGTLSNPPAAAASTCAPSLSATSGGGWPASVTVQGQCFTPGGSVSVSVYDHLTGAQLIFDQVTASTNSVICGRLACYFSGGGSFKDSTYSFTLCGYQNRQLDVYAFDWQTWRSTSGGSVIGGLCLH